MKKATIKDVARESGLSLGTVSKYLNGSRGVKQANQIKIKQAIANLRYSPDEYARGLITNKTKTIGLVIPEFNNLFYAQLASELELAIGSEGYTVVVCESFYDTEREKKNLLWFASHRMSALVVVPCGKNAENYDYLKSIDIPIIFLDQYIAGLNYEFVLVNNREVCETCIEYLLDNGHRDILMVVAPKGLYTSDERVNGYYDAYENRGLNVNEDLIMRVEENIDKAYYCIKKKLQETRCTALFAANFPNTFGSIFTINELKISIPDDLSFVGFDDMMLTKLFRPKLTMIDQPIAEIAMFAKRRIFELMLQKNFEYRITKLNCSFLVYDSVKDIRGK